MATSLAWDAQAGDRADSALLKDKGQGRVLTGSRVRSGLEDDDAGAARGKKGHGGKGCMGKKRYVYGAIQNRDGGLHKRWAAGAKDVELIRSGVNLNHEEVEHVKGVLIFTLFMAENERRGRWEEGLGWRVEGEFWGGVGDGWRRRGGVRWEVEGREQRWGGNRRRGNECGCEGKGWEKRAWRRKRGEGRSGEGRRRKGSGSRRLGGVRAREEEIRSGCKAKAKSKK
ncbi:hypothetical protein Tco_0519824 [Tanacetum coccineum]